MYSPKAERITPRNVPDALSVLNEWQDNSRTTPDKTDFEQCREALLLISELALWGQLYYIDHHAAGFILGEELNADTFCLHFAKASRHYHGIYEFMFNETAKQLQHQYKYLNLEEDMGNKNLRRTKLSYGPVALIKKFRISARGER